MRFLKTKNYLLKTLFIALMFLCASAHADNFLWNQANARMGTASAPHEFAEAATLYRSVIERGANTAPAYYNYGTALLLADAPAAAMDALLRAERLGGTTPDLQRNLDLAITKMAQSEDGAGKADAFAWLRTPLFWHYTFSLNTRLLIAIIAFNFVFAMLLSGIFVRRSRRHRIIAGLLGIIAFALFATSALVSWHQNTAPLPEPIYAWEGEKK